MGAVKSSPEQWSPWYRARKPLPAVAGIVVLSVLAGLVWWGVLNRPDPTAGGCRAAAAAAESAAPVVVTPGERLSATGLDTVPPAPPQAVTVQVLNANGERGEAGVVSVKLAELGFVPTAEPTNDPLHPDFDLRCHGEIRFGSAGEAAARTLSLAVPCAELVRDARPDEVVDLALGTEFTQLRPNDAGREALRGLMALGPPVEPSRNNQAARPAAAAVDPELLRQARAMTC
jgi:hypothetical protein